MRNATALWDAIVGRDEPALRRALPQHQAAKGKELFRLAREHLARRVTEKMAGGRFELFAPEGDGPSQFVIRHGPLRLIDAIWQRFAEEAAGIIACAKCPAPKCGRWFLRNTGRSDRGYCCSACRIRAWAWQVGMIQSVSLPARTCACTVHRTCRSRRSNENCDNLQLRR